MPNADHIVSDETRPAGHRWPVLASLAGYRLDHLGADLVAGLILAAITIPEQMATARLGGFPPEAGFYAFVAGAIGFALLGANRFLSAGADSTITPIFASGLAVLAVTGTPAYAALAAALALIVGIILVLGGLLRLGWIADLLSMPVTTGFLGGIALHIAVSQLPGLLGVPASDGSLLHSLAAIERDLGRANPISLALGAGVLGLMIGAERVSPRIPGALIGLAGTTAAVLFLDLEHRGVAVLGPVPSGLPAFAVPDTTLAQLGALVPLACIIAIVAMVQTAATTRSFPSDPGVVPAVNRDFIGIGVGNLLAGLFGAFPVNASPPRTAIVAETGGRSQIAGLIAAALVLGLAAFGAKLLAHVPQAALAGMLLFIAIRILRLRAIIAIFRNTRAEFMLVIATMLAIVALPIETGVAVGVGLSLLHGMWTTTRAQPVEFERIPGTTIWWVPNPKLKGEILPGTVVIAFQAPLSFLNAYDFRRGVLTAIARRTEPVRRVVLESSSIIAIDYTASTILADVIGQCRARSIDFSVARLESARAQEAFARFGLLDLLGPDHLFHSVDEAVRSLAIRDV